MKFCSFILSSALFLIFMASSVASASVPLCHQLLIPAIATSTPMTQLVKQLAEMKLRLDIDQALGNISNLAQGLIKNQYPKLLAEFVRSQKDTHSEKEITAMITKEIRALQEKNLMDKRKVEAQRALQDELFRLPYNLKETNIPVAQNLTTSFNDAFFLPERETIYAIRKGSLHATDFEGRDHSIVSAEAITYLNKDSGFLVKNGDKLLTVTTDNNQIRSSYELTFRSDENSKVEFESLQVNTEGNFVLMKGPLEASKHRNLSIVDLKMHREVLSFELSVKASDAVFIDNNKVAVIYEKEKIEIIEIPSGKVLKSRKIIMNEEGNTPRIEISKSGKHLAIFNDIEILSVPTQDIALEMRSLKQDKGITISRKLTQANAYPNHLLESDYSGGGKLINLDTMSVKFDFQEKYRKDDNNLFRFIPSPDGKTLLALYAQTDGIRKRYKIDIWEQGPQPK